MPKHPAPIHATSNFPHELTSLILTQLIHLYNHDPATQWTQLRHITRFHKAQIENYFLTYWLPRLRILMYDVCPAFDAEPMEYRYDAHIETDIVHFRCIATPPDDHTVKYNWAEALYSNSDARRIILRLASPLLNNGYAGGCILTDTRISSPRSDATGVDLWFNWKILFTHMFAEEMLVKGAREDAMRIFELGLKVTLRDKRDEAIWDALRKNYTALRGKVLAAHRAGRACQAYKMQTRFVANGPDEHVAAKIRREVSMIFYVPGWQSWSVRKIAAYRAREEKANWNLNLCEEVVGGSRGGWWDGLVGKWSGWEGREERSEGELEGELRGGV